ncbi:MAG: hypothetical protein K5917_01005 [Clostridiales bacterium]|nr:hypothetical protein [Clostridiales bacterium]
MKQIIIKKGIKAISFVITLLLVLLLLSLFFRPKESENFKANDIKPLGVLAEAENSLDVLFFGDSEAYTSFSPISFWDKEGFSSFVCASSAQYLSLTKSFVEQALENQSPKVVVIETNAFFRKIRSENSFWTRFENLFSILEYHNRWKNFIPLKIEATPYSWKDDLKGYKIYKMAVKCKCKDYMQKTDQIESIPETNIQYVKDIVNYCKDKNIEVLFVSTPSIKNWNYERHNAVENLAKEVGADYLDLNLQESIKINWKTDTADAGDHLNFKGAEKVSTFIAPYLAEKYNLENKKGNSEFEEWNKLVSKYQMIFDKKSYA